MTPRRPATGLGATLTDISAAEAKRPIAACVAIYSAPFWQMLRDRGQLSARDAEEAAAAAMTALISAARIKAANIATKGRK